MGLELERDLELFFSKNLKLTMYDGSSSSCVFCVAPFLMTLKEHLQPSSFAHLMTQKSLNLVEEWGNYGKVFDERYVFGDERVLLTR